MRIEVSLPEYALDVMRAYSDHCRAARARAFAQLLTPDPDMRVLDLGGGDGGHLARHLPQLRNVVVADIIPERLAVARERYGYETYLLTEDEEALPFEDGAFDLVFCSSVVEHVTGPKAWVRNCGSRREFEASAAVAQRRFAAEIARVGLGYWVQTPNRNFPIEPHCQLPMPIIWTPRSFQQRINRYWLKQALLDFRPLTASDMRGLFPDGELYLERWGGFVKSVTSYRRPAAREVARVLTPIAEASISA